MGTKVAVSLTALSLVSFGLLFYFFFLTPGGG